MLSLRYSTILSVAIPLMGSSFIQSVVMITDSSFLSRYSTVAFDASGNAGLIYITMFVAIMGMSDGAQILMARRIGEQREDMLARIFGTSLLVNLILAVSLFTLIQFILPDLIRSFTNNQEIATGEIDFVRIRSYGLFFAMISLAINAYFISMGKTFIVLISAAMTALTNIGLDYALIFGNFGMTEMGLKGAAYASTIADATAMIFLIFVLTFSTSRKKHKLYAHLTYNYTSLVNLLKVGTPIMGQGLVALITWTAFFIWIEHKGTYELTVSQNIRALYFLAFVPVWGFAGTTKTYVSQYIGNNAFKDIKIIQRRIQLMTVIFLVVMFHGALVYPEKLVSMINPEAEYVKGSAEILRFIFGSIIIYGLTSVYFQTINGSGNTRYTFIIESLSVGVYLFSAYLFIKVLDWNIYRIWSVEYIYFITLGALSIGYLRYFNWQKKVI